MPRVSIYKGSPTSVYNLGSQAVSERDFARNKLWARMDADMGRKAVHIPVFLVNEAQMDILFPPKYRRALNPDRLRDRLQRTPSDFDIDYLDWNDWDVYEKIVTVGVYVKEPPDATPAADVLNVKGNHKVTPEAEDAFRNHGGPRIYLCGERIASWAHDKGAPVNLVLDKVYYHELGHALMDTYRGPADDNPYYTTWGRVIEECSANYMAYSRFSGKEARFVQKLISDQPAEYLGYVGLTRVQPFPLPMDEPGRWDTDDQKHHKEMLRRFFEEGSIKWPDFLWRRGYPHRWYHEWMDAWMHALRRLRMGHWDWDDVWHFFRDHGFLPFPPFWGWGPWMPEQFRPNTDRAVASFNIRLWRHYKEKGAPRDPEYVILLKEWALYLLKVGVLG